jgi:hypothetical protein
MGDKRRARRIEFCLTSEMKASTNRGRRDADNEAVPIEAQFNIVARGARSGVSGRHPLRGVQGATQGWGHPRDGDFPAQDGRCEGPRPSRRIGMRPRTRGAGTRT